MIEAAYAIKEYIAATLDTADLEVGNFYPGHYAPSKENSNKFVLYHVLPNDTPDLFGLKDDVINFTFYNTDFDEIHRVGSVVRDTFNVWNIQYSSLSEDDIRFVETEARITGEGQASFVDGQDYYLLNVAVMVKYTSA